jgi:DNA-binding response OmpR family regulator
MRVLVVEDARALADVLVEGLRDQGMAVDVARDGLEAAAKLDVNGYDVVVLDRDLPGIHGDILCQMITERDERVMVLMLTAAGSPGDRVSGLGLGADDYLAKPFHFPELVARIRALARRQPSVRARVLRAAGIELDPMRRTVTRDGRQLDLSAKEFGVLEALLRARPGFLSAEDLLEQVWDEQADPFTNTVTVTIGRLRRKLGDPPVITTMPTVGYRIADQPAPSEAAPGSDAAACAPPATTGFRTAGGASRMITAQDVRAVALALPRTEEHLIRDRVKFRVGKIVYVAISPDETIMGFAFPREERAAMIAAEPHRFFLDRPSDQRFNWIDTYMALTSPAEMREFVSEAWRMVVPKRAAAAHLERPGASRRRESATSLPRRAADHGDLHQ